MREVQLREMLGVTVVDSEGEAIGKLEEVEAIRGDEYCEITSYFVEHRGLLNRLSSWAVTSGLRKKLIRHSRPYRVAWNQMDLSDPAHPRTLVPKDLLERASRR
jgi:sporulation protein YlmC with PRC-barrel domain